MIYLRRIVGNSMATTLRNGQYVIAVRRKQYHKGDIVMFRHDGMEKIKRIHTVSDTKAWVRGDNLSESTDSRDFGYIPLENIIGSVVLNNIKRIFLLLVLYGKLYSLVK